MGGANIIIIYFDPMLD